MIPLKDLRPLLADRDPNSITEFKLLDFEFFDELKFAKQIAERYKLIFIDLSKAKINDQIIKSIKKSHATQFRCIPIQKTPKGITVATFDPSILALRTDIQVLFQENVEFILTSISSWKKLYQRVDEAIEDLLDSIHEVRADEKVEVELKEEDIGDEVINYVNRIMAEAFIKGASDIHVEPYEKRFRIRFRIDGTLQEVATPPKALALPIISRIKILANLDISEKRKPQDGRIKLSIRGEIIDFRVSSLPTLFGEKVVLRLLDATNLELDMTKLGFEPKQLEIFKKGIFRPYGICLVTGPTGSGKTTTLYSAISELNQIGTNISTIEDPVEFNLEGINQVSMKKEIGLTFAAALKSFLRQDPDIIMVGEIRDSEVGEIAIEAALTGHLVLSTLHTNDSASTITRLLNMGLEPFLLTDALNVVVAQRLCRKICEHCKTVQEVAVEDLVRIGFAQVSAEKIKVYKGSGCNACGHTGYSGRVAIYEVLEITQAVCELILKEASADLIKRQGIREGMKTLRMSALTKVALGVTTIEEALRNSAADKF